MVHPCLVASHYAIQEPFPSSLNSWRPERAISECWLLCFSLRHLATYLAHSLRYPSFSWTAVSTLPIDNTNAAHKYWIVCLRVSRVVFSTHVAVTSVLCVGGRMTRSSLWMADHFRTLHHFLACFTLMPRHHKFVAVDSEFLSGICCADKNRMTLRISSQDQVSLLLHINWPHAQHLPAVAPSVAC
jgi:hypothetical protein